MTPAERSEIEALANDVCPATYQGHPCEQPRGHKGSRHWSGNVNGWGVNWPDELSDQAVEDIAS